MAFLRLFRVGVVLIFAFKKRIDSTWNNKKIDANKMGFDQKRISKLYISSPFNALLFTRPTQLEIKTQNVCFLCILFQRGRKGKNIWKELKKFSVSVVLSILCFSHIYQEWNISFLFVPFHITFEIMCGHYIFLV